MTVLKAAMQQKKETGKNPHTHTVTHSRVMCFIQQDTIWREGCYASVCVCVCLCASLFFLHENVRFLPMLHFWAFKIKQPCILHLQIKAASIMLSQQGNHQPWVTAAQAVQVTHLSWGRANNWQYYIRKQHEELKQLQPHVIPVKPSQTAGCV